MSQFGFGAGTLITWRTDVSPSTPVEIGAFQDLSVDVSGAIKEGYGGYRWPIALAGGKGKIDCKAKSLLINSHVWSDLFFGNAAVVSTGQLKQAYKEPQAVPTTGLTSSPALAIGGTTTAVASGAFGYNISGTPYTKTAVAAGTALAAGTIPQNKWGIYLLSINAAGTIAVTPGAGNATGYNTEALAIAALPATGKFGLDGLCDGHKHQFRRICRGHDGPFRLRDHRELLQYGPRLQRNR